MDPLRQGLLRKSRHPLEMVALLALLIAMALPLAQTKDRIRRAERMRCHVCEAENSFNCTNPVDCPHDKQFCVVAAVRIFERFYLTSKQCTKACPVPALLLQGMRPNVPPEPKPFLVQNSLPFIYTRCCKWSLCNQGGPNMPKFKEQPGKASERRETELSLTVFIVLTVPALTDLSLL
ncbi:lymphocyte antigen 6K-like [Mesocricetus auratus]|uniref:Lymphocyte antigen 6K-like n=1 Tax=Mesocricetus auratus TaxID=10036 RepID=A0ABM2WNQ8_MESAU|nr:lymphocyte antigen 6K-like [Mesocricetus auratus]XP_040592420.1 lymphocyte antigen 6K-like [Mesocricetus auratus]